MSKLTHFDEGGNAIMVDVTDKKVTKREAVACGEIYVSSEIMEAITNQKIKKGDVLSVAQIAGIMGAKQTATLLPLCHPLSLSKCSVTFEIHEDKGFIKAFARVQIEGKTGVEMEALTSVSIALLTVYDMCKAIDKRMHIENIHVIKKRGGKSGEFQYE